MSCFGTCRGSHSVSLILEGLGRSCAVSLTGFLRPLAAAVRERSRGVPRAANSSTGWSRAVSESVCVQVVFPCGAAEPSLLSLGRVTGEDLRCPCGCPSSLLYSSCAVSSLRSSGNSSSIDSLLGVQQSHLSAEKKTLDCVLACACASPPAFCCGRARQKNSGHGRGR
eukprot:1623062-Rhodomonas_salina.1